MSSSAQGLTEKKAQRMTFIKTGVRGQGLGIRKKIQSPTPNPQSPIPKAVVLLSGGIDSSTTAAIAKHEGYEVYALSFDYNQRHKIELEAAKKVALALKIKKHLVIKFNLRAIGGSALTSEMEVPKDRKALGVMRNESKDTSRITHYASRISPSLMSLPAIQSFFRLRLHGPRRLRPEIYLSAQMQLITAVIRTAVPNI